MSIHWDEIGIVTLPPVVDPAGGGGSTYQPQQYHQTSPAATWTISHVLGGAPGVVLILDSAPNEQVYTDIKYPDDHTVVVEWPTAVSGWAYIG